MPTISGTTTVKGFFDSAVANFAAGNYVFGQSIGSEGQFVGVLNIASTSYASGIATRYGNSNNAKKIYKYNRFNNSSTLYEFTGTEVNL